MKYRVTAKPGTWIQVERPGDLATAAETLRGGSFTIEGEGLEFVALPAVGYVKVRLFEIEGTWTYIDPLPDQGEEPLGVGEIVKVPFGYNNSLMLGKVVEVMGESGLPDSVHVKTVRALMNPTVIST